MSTHSSPTPTLITGRRSGPQALASTERQAVARRAASPLHSFLFRFLGALRALNGYVGPYGADLLSFRQSKAPPAPLCRVS